MNNLKFGKSDKTEQQENENVITYNVKRGDLFYKTINEPFTEKEEFAANFTSREIAEIIAKSTNGVVVVSENVKDLNGDEFHD